MRIFSSFPVHVLLRKIVHRDDHKVLAVIVSLQIFRLSERWNENPSGFRCNGTRPYIFKNYTFQTNSTTSLQLYCLLITFASTNSDNVFKIVMNLPICQIREHWSQQLLLDRHCFLFKDLYLRTYRE